jgi:hypothetical protein
MKDDALTSIVRAIAVVTIASGGVQLVAPGLILGPLGAEQSPATLQFFGIIGMFMVVIGGVLRSALAHPESSGGSIGWTAVQKFGASAAVLVGVLRHVFSGLALAVALFDLVSALVIVALWRRIHAGVVAPATAR